MTDIISFYTNPFSRGRTVHWMLEEAGAPHRIQLLDFDRGDHKQPGFLALNPMGKVPAIVHRGVVVTEAAAICAYLADAFSEAKLAPAPGDPARGAYYRWLFFAASNFEPALLAKHFPPSKPVPASSLGYGTLEDVLDGLERAITPGPFVLGDQFSAADVYIASQLGWALMMKFIEPRPAFGAYLERTSRRPGWLRFLEKNGELEEQLKAQRAEGG